MPDCPPFHAAWRLRPESAGSCKVVSMDSDSAGHARLSRDVVFAGAIDRLYRPSDTADGTDLWWAQRSDLSESALITHSVTGKQNVAVVTGYTTLPSVVPNPCAKL